MNDFIIPPKSYISYPQKGLGLGSGLEVDKLTDSALLSTWHENLAFISPVDSTTSFSTVTEAIVFLTCEDRCLFVEAGGAVLFNSIEMRPGKAVLFGVLGRTLFFGLPGPPYAVRTLLNELVGPALLAMQGVEGAWPKVVQAHLLHKVDIKRNDVLRLKDGVLTFSEGNCLVRFAGRLEIPDCFVLLPPGRTRYDEGSLVEVHLVNRL